MSKKTEITICLGSSCFARGNKKTLESIQSYINEHKLSEKVFLNGGHCFGHCNNGPIIKVNNTIYENVDPISVLDILAKELDKYSLK